VNGQAIGGQAVSRQDCRCNDHCGPEAARYRGPHLLLQEPCLNRPKARLHPRLDRHQRICRGGSALRRHEGARGETRRPNLKPANNHQAKRPKYERIPAIRALLPRRNSPKYLNNTNRRML
jgi:hypothetical protein